MCASYQYELYLSVPDIGWLPSMPLALAHLDYYSSTSSYWIE